MSTAPSRLRMLGISKQFPGVKALDNVSLEVRSGGIVGLVGVNGAGKSTLMNVLGGIYHPDSGDILLDGRQVRFHSPKDAERHGISFIHQELLFFASQTVAENIFISHLFMNPVLPIFVSKATANREAKRYLAMLGSDISPTATMENLSVGERQVVEIARALAMGSDIVIFDEPTSSLSLKEKEILFGVVRRLREEGKAIIYITHFLDEMLDICDTFVVLRNGSVHGSGQVADITKNDIIRMIVGRDIHYGDKVDRRTVASEPVLRVEGICSGTLLRDLSFDLNKGEILGIWGLMGSGRTELIRAVLGLDRIDAGTTYLVENGVARAMPPRQLLAHCGYVTESRHTDGLFLVQPVTRNISAPALGGYATGLFSFINIRKETEAAVHYIDLLKVATPGPSTLVQGLSGGNQQKVVFAKWLNRDAHILIMDEPTRGVDVSAKLEISNLIMELACKGTAILLITSEAEEMVSLADRVLVLRDGRFVAALTGDSINNALLMQMALGGELVA